MTVCLINKCSKVQFLRLPFLKLVKQLWSMRLFEAQDNSVQFRELAPFFKLSCIRIVVNPSDFLSDNRGSIPRCSIKFLGEFDSGEKSHTLEKCMGA